ncbi:pyridoxamine 5'-phosphate oxidase family protein [Rhodococcus sp. T7]|uniref:pyridoxamine 5'-phosphate oxidase family protein n=1 Tax=Rhodococcus sp. T7 TaxID=627444 RepID=UPI0013CAF6CB|nr:pyridoxamine 5'-phosphate oxidase family protein [Rhodococcus sp. T7]KAF0957125.1 hypothetical protein MLGJGCBP_08955 [Rhodococcus sp. T7]KAF0958850.1 hypothetical protein MLGJGCBP_08044 [Rhodococcus sp. T7]
MGLGMDAAERSAFVEQGHTGILTTLRRDGCPVTLPVWFAPIDGVIYVASPSGAAKVKRLERDDRCWFMVERGNAWTELAAVGFAARGRTLAPGDEAARAAAALADRYAAFRPADESLPAAMRTHYADQVIIRIEPVDEPLSWDNSKARLTGT